MDCSKITVLFSAMMFVSSSIQSSQKMSLIVEGVDESAGNVPCYVIKTSAATYYLEKEGLGLSSMVDRDGIDWISAVEIVPMMSPMKGLVANWKSCSARCAVDCLKPVPIKETATMSR